MTTLNELLRVKAAYIQWVSDWKWQRMTAITLTCKRSEFENRDLHCKRLEQNMRHFINKLCKRMKVKRENLQIFVVNEGVPGNPHHHLTLERPEHISPERLEELINEIWPRTRWGCEQIKIVNGANSGWIAYCLKLRTKSDYHDSIDTNNTHSV